MIICTYEIVQIFIYLNIWYVTADFYKKLHWSFPWKMLAFVAKSKIAYYLYLPLSPLLIIAVWYFILGFTFPISVIFAVVLFQLMIYTYQAIPPSVLFLGTSRKETIDFREYLERSLHPYRVVVLLDASVAETESYTAFQHNILAWDNIRTRLDEDWRKVVNPLMEMVPIIVIDTRIASPAVVEETERALTLFVQKTVFVTNQYNRSPSIEATGMQLPEKEIHYSRLEQLVPLLKTLGLTKIVSPYNLPGSVQKKMEDLFNTDSKYYSVQTILQEDELEYYSYVCRWPIPCPECASSTSHAYSFGRFVNAPDCDDATLTCPTCGNHLIVSRYDHVLSVSTPGLLNHERYDNYQANYEAGIEEGIAGHLEIAQRHLSHALGWIRFDREVKMTLEFIEDALAQKIQRESAIQLLKGARYSKLGKFEDSMDAIQIALSTDPDYPPTLVALGVLYLNYGMVDEAENRFIRVITIDPNYAAGHYNLGVLYDTQGRAEDAAAKYLDALGVDLSFVEAHNNLAFYYRNRGEFQLMTQHRDEAIKMGLIVDLKSLHRE